MKNYIIPYGERFVNMGMGYKRTLMCVDNLGLVVRHSLETMPAPEDVRNYLVGWNEQNTILIQADSLQDALLKFYDLPECKTGTKHRAWELIGTEKNPVIEYCGCKHIRFTESGAMACGIYGEPEMGGHMTCILEMNDEPPTDCPIDEQLENKGWRSEVVQIGGVWVKRYTKFVSKMEPLINGIKPR